MPGTWRPRAVLAARGVVLGAGVALVAACTTVPVPGETITPTVVVDKTSPPDPVVPTVWPLTGLEGEIVSRPAISVKIENTIQARPQTGLEDADMVWETVVEFGVPRLVAVYHSTMPEEVGPIRSIRPADAQIASPLGGLMAFSGGQTGIISLMRGTPLQLLSHDDGDDGFYRIRSRVAPHNVYGSMADFLRQADREHRDPPAAQFAFASRAGRSAAEVQGTPTSRIVITLSPGAKPSWTWDAEGGVWNRSENGAAAMSADGERLSATNVVIVRVETFDSGYDAQAGAPVPDVRLVAEGEGLLATGGRSVEVTWSKEGRAEPLVLTGPDGAVATLAPGTTWVELVPVVGGSVTVE